MPAGVIEKSHTEGADDRARWWVLASRECLSSSFCASPSQCLLDGKSALKPPTNTPLEKGQERNSVKSRPLPVGKRGRSSENAWRGRARKVVCFGATRAPWFIHPSLIILRAATSLPARSQIRLYPTTSPRKPTGARQCEIVVRARQRCSHI